MFAIDDLPGNGRSSIFKSFWVDALIVVIVLVLAILGYIFFKPL